MHFDRLYMLSISPVDEVDVIVKVSMTVAEGLNVVLSEGIIDTVKHVLLVQL